MFKKVYILVLSVLLLLSSCGNEESDFPSDSTASNSTSAPVAYKVTTLVLFESPYASEMFFHLINLANFNKIESSYFIILNIHDPEYKAHIKTILDSTADNINIISLKIPAQKIPLIEDITPRIGKAVFLFPSDKPKLEKTDNTATAMHIFPENYSYINNTIKLRYSMQDKVFLGEVLKYIASGNINKPVISSVDEIGYIQGYTEPGANIRLLQTNSSRKFQEKNTSVALEDGNIIGISIDPQKNIQVQITHEKKLSTYWIDKLTSSFLYFHFKPVDTNQIIFSSYFTPLNLDYIFIEDKPLKINTENEDKAIYSIIFTLDPTLDSQIKTWSGNYKDGVLNITIPQELAPISYTVTESSWNIPPASFVKIFAPVKETKKDYESRSSSSGVVTLSIEEDIKSEENTQSEEISDTLKNEESLQKEKNPDSLESYSDESPPQNEGGKD